MFVFEQTPEFSRWLLNLKDPQGKTRVPVSYTHLTLPTTPYV